MELVKLSCFLLFVSFSELNVLPICFNILCLSSKHCKIWRYYIVAYVATCYMNCETKTIQDLGISEIYNGVLKRGYVYAKEKRHRSDTGPIGSQIFHLPIPPKGYSCISDWDLLGDFQWL